MILPNWAVLKHFELNTSSYRVFYGLSENHKIIEIEQMEINYRRLKLILRTAHILPRIEGNFRGPTFSRISTKLRKFYP